MAELEKELSQVRAFYTRKLKEVGRRAENQMRALKRGRDRKSGSDSVDGRLEGGDRGGNDTPDGMVNRTALAAGGARRDIEGVIGGGRNVGGKSDGENEDDESNRNGINPDGNDRRKAQRNSAEAAAAAAEEEDQEEDQEEDKSPRQARPAASRRGGPRDRLSGVVRMPQESGGSPNAERNGCGAAGLVGGSSLEEVLRAERARHEQELDRERQAAEARLTSLKTRLVETAQVCNRAVKRKGRKGNIMAFPRS